MPKPHHKRPAPEQTAAAKPGSAAQTVAASGPKTPAARSVSADLIRLCAYRKWEVAGKPAGDGAEFWLEAERELLHGK